MNTDFLQEAQEMVQQKLWWFRDDAGPGRKWLNVHPPNEPSPPRYEVLQTYLMMRILERLESIDDTLIAINSPRDKP